jgi:hypothetical protein
MIIDAHNHSHYNGFGPEGLLAEMTAFGIDRTWLLTWYLPPGEHAPMPTGPLTRAICGPMAPTLA